MVSMRATQGFTIVELLIAIVVIGILASITVVAFGGIRDRAEATAAQTHLNQLHKGLEIYKATHGSYPALSGWHYSCYDAEHWPLIGYLEEVMTIPPAPCESTTGIDDSWAYSSDGQGYKLLYIRPENVAAMKKHIPAKFHDPVRWNSEGSWGYWTSGWESF